MKVRYIPQGSTAQEFSAVNAVVYLCDAGKLAAIGYAGKATNPAFHYTFRNVEQRSQYISNWIERLEASQKNRRERAAARAEKLAQPQPFKVGDVLTCSWGYEQTNVDFYEVVGTYGKRGVIVRQLQAGRTETGFMQGTTAPALGQYRGEPIRKIVNESGSVKMYKWGGYARLWDGKAQWCSWYA